MGNINARSLGKLQREAHEGKFDMVLHIGDLAYNLDTPISASVPYMTVVGNHEFNYNFTHYINRFTMPNPENQNLFFSFDLGTAHFIGFSTELYFWPIYYRHNNLATQWQWLIKDLEKANLNRHNVPWIITMGHRPMYCSTFTGDDCTQYNSITRTGLPFGHDFALEELFFKYGVDLEIWGHEHTFERMYPVYNRTVYNGSDANPYVDPPAPVHVVSGSAGCQEKTDTFSAHPGPWSAFRSTNYGFSRMHIVNSTHLYLEQTIAADETIEDYFWLVKNRHGPYELTDRKRLRRHGTYVPQNYCHHPSQCNKIVANSQL
uniref:Metallophos domain-containing protein n=1 Tax=Globodera pallida TaxID=36090 RepID=A0A183BKW7_GLOPA